MSWEYDLYLKEHVDAVHRSYWWLMNNLRPELDEDALLQCGLNIRTHDSSKYDVEEYDAYDRYFYGEKTPAVKEDFNRAWLHHIHQNGHHWQHWVLIEDDAPDGYICIEMPLEYVYEMICDWWSFSWRSKKLTEIFDWWEKHRNIRLHDKTRAEVVRILTLIRAKLKEVEEDGHGV